jgi:hypothetical protein
VKGESQKGKAERSKQKVKSEKLKAQCKIEIFKKKYIDSANF